MKENKATTSVLFFFSKYFWAGFMWLLFAIILEEKYLGKTFGHNVLIELIFAISIAIIVASIFTYALGTNEFIQKIRDLLEDIVVSRVFLGNLSVGGKTEALKEMLKPSEMEKDKYLNIEKYYEDYIERTLDISDKNVRSNYSIEANFFYDKVKEKVGARAVYSYRLYPSNSGFKKIPIGFDEADKDSYCEKVVINLPDGTRFIVNDIKTEEEEGVGSKDRFGGVDISEYDNQFDHLDIQLHVCEYGQDHWFMYTFKALQPTDGFKLHIRCNDGVEIRKYAVFDTGNAYHVDHLTYHEEESGEIELMITCHQWIREGVGVSVLLSFPHQIDPVELQKFSRNQGERSPATSKHIT